jgi:hypothetical protein
MGTAFAKFHNMRNPLSLIAFGMYLSLSVVFYCHSSAAACMDFFLRDQVKSSLNLDKIELDDSTPPTEVYLHYRTEQDLLNASAEIDWSKQTNKPVIVHNVRPITANDPLPPGMLAQVTPPGEYNKMTLLKDPSLVGKILAKGRSTYKLEYFEESIRQIATEMDELSPDKFDTIKVLIQFFKEQSSSSDKLVLNGSETAIWYIKSKSGSDYQSVPFKSPSFETITSERFRYIKGFLDQLTEKVIAKEKKLEVSEVTLIQVKAGKGISISPTDNSILQLLHQYVSKNGRTPLEKSEAVRVINIPSEGKEDIVFQKSIIGTK